ncbi:MAG: phosphoribosylformylglycinamidine cyclo-ligase, partial [Spirochaetota bacterium]
MKPRSYEESGVSIERGDAFAGYLAGLKSPAMGRLGGFAGGLQIDLARYREPVLLSTTDGVGTKLLVAKELNDYRTVGIDLVAMCVNDLAVCGARPELFLDYIACGTIDDSVLHQVIEGIVRGCEIAGCILAGGETAELPDMYAADDIDLAGFAVGIVDKSHQLPRLETVAEGDLVVGLASSGVHSNGLTLARNVVDHGDEQLMRRLLEPTRIYVNELLAAEPCVKAAAHITGGGLPGNLARVVPPGLRCELTWRWPMPDVFAQIQQAGGIDEEEMRAVFNMGVGIALVVAPSRLEELEAALGRDVICLG